MLSDCSYVSAEINLQHVFKMSPPKCTHASSRTRHWSMDALTTSCSMLLQTFSRHWVTLSFAETKV